MSRVISASLDSIPSRRRSEQPAAGAHDHGVLWR
jgi:hypothetical protein